MNERTHPCRLNRIINSILQKHTSRRNIDGGTVGADELSARLWRERRQLDYLLYILETQLLHLQAGNWHRLNFTAAEIEKVIENLRFDSLARTIEASALVSEWSDPRKPVALAPAGLWQGLLEEHRHAMASLLTRIDKSVAANTSLLHNGPGVAGVPHPAANAPDDAAGVALEANIRRALAAIASATLPAVREYLAH